MAHTFKDPLHPWHNVTLKYALTEQQEAPYAVSFPADDEKLASFIANLLLHLMGALDGITEFNGVDLNTVDRPTHKE